MDEESKVQQSEVAAVQTEEAAPSKKKGFFGKNLKFIIPGIIIVAAIIVGAIFFLGGKADKVACNYAVAELDWDYKEVQKYIAYDYANYLVAYTNFKDLDELLVEYGDMDDIVYNSWDDFCKNNKTERAFDIEELYGNYSIEAKFKSEKPVSAKTIKEHIGEKEYDSIELGGFTYADIDEYKCVNVRVYFNGTEKNNTVDMEVFLAKVGMGWKVVGSAFVNDD